MTIEGLVLRSLTGDEFDKEATVSAKRLMKDEPRTDILAVTLTFSVKTTTSPDCAPVTTTEEPLPLPLETIAISAPPESAPAAPEK